MADPVTAIALFSMVHQAANRPKAPAPPKPKPVAPTADDDASKKATQRMLARRGEESGRMSTMLTNEENKLG